MMFHRLFAIVAAAALMGAAAPPKGVPGAVRLSAAQQSALRNYIGAVGGGRYAEAYKLLTAGEQKYFGSVENFSSSFSADRLKIGHYKLMRAERAGAKGVVAIVSEDVEFFDHGHQGAVSATARVAYGLIDEGGSVRIKDPYHPWRVVVPKNASAEVEKFSVTVRKVSFFTGRVELLLSFINLSDTTVTALPYGRSVLKDDRGQVQHLLAVKMSGLTDKNLYLGLRLPASGQYTGALTFLTPDRYAPKRLDLVVGKMLRDGAEAPFEVVLPPVEIQP